VACAQNERLEDLRTAVDRIRRDGSRMGPAAFERADQEALIPMSWSFVVIGEVVKALPEDLLDGIGPWTGRVSPVAAMSSRTDTSGLIRSFFGRRSAYRYRRSARR
jgi:hypothetical protein